MTGGNIEEVLAREGVFVSTTVGISMYPMLRNRRDTIIISPCNGRLNKYDIPLYRRGEKYVLHRIVDVTQEGYVICGDNCLQKEYDITDKEVIGVLTGFYRGDKKINMQGMGYRSYVRVWCALYPVRCMWKRLRGRLASAYRRMIKRGTYENN